MDDLLFQFTPLREGRREAVGVWKRLMRFQFTPLREGRRTRRRCGNGRFAISIHAPPRGATGGGRRVETADEISIHAPPRGATRREMRKPYGRGISIHAPPRGATAAHAVYLLKKNFNSRPSARGDVSRGGTKNKAPISIHAPPRGATRGQEETDEPHQHFNSRPSARGDVLPPRNPLAAPHFNSRPSARGDRHSLREKNAPTYFNSRPSARGDGQPWAR